jgi:hypothetical protein
LTFSSHLPIIELNPERRESAGWEEALSAHELAIGPEIPSFP